MQTCFRPVFIALTSCLLGACASTPPPTLVLVGKDNIEVFGQTLHSAAELSAALSAQKVTSVELKPLAGAGYEQIGAAIFGITRSGADVERVGPVIVEK